MKEELVYLGVDIAKAYLDAAIGNEKRRFSNDAVGHRELINWIKQIAGPVQVICEPSGGYERAFVQALARARMQVSLVQANRVRAFARELSVPAVPKERYYLALELRDSTRICQRANFALYKLIIFALFCSTNFSDRRKRP